MRHPAHGRAARPVVGLLAALALLGSSAACSDDSGSDDAADDVVGDGDTYRATIRRTEGGIPHITGDSLGDMLVFGNDLYDETNTDIVGRDQGSCFRTNVGISWECTFTAILDDGSIAAGGFRSEDMMSLLRIAEGQATGTTFEGTIPWVTTDGSLLYGFDGDDGAPHSLDPGEPVPAAVQWFLARDDSPYMVTLNDGEMIVEIPDSGLTRTLQMRYSEDPEVVAHGGIEVETGIDGTIFIMMYGAPESDEALGIGGFVSVAPDGAVSQAEPIFEPFSPSDPGSPSHLGVTPGTSTPWIMLVGEDGVRVFTRAG